jgi:hypothetical protein
MQAGRLAGWEWVIDWDRPWQEKETRPSPQGPRNSSLRFGSMYQSLFALLLPLPFSFSSSSFLPSFFFLLSFPHQVATSFPSPPSITRSSSLLLSIRGLVILGKRHNDQCLRYSAFRPCTPVSGTLSRYLGPLIRPSSLLFLQFQTTRKELEQEDLPYILLPPEPSSPRI